MRSVRRLKPFSIPEVHIFPQRAQRMSEAVKSPRATRPCHKQPTWAVANTPSEAGFRHAIISARQSFADLTSFVANTGFRLHSGACDVLIVRHKRALRTSQWHVHLGRDICVRASNNARLLLQVSGNNTDLVMRVDADNKGFFEACASDLRPTVCQLGALPLKSGCNEAHFLVEEQEPGGTWGLKGKIPIGVYVWDASDRVVVADIEDVVIKGSIWSKSADVVMLQTTLGSVESVRDGVGPLFSYLDRAGYRVLLLKATPITRADRVREAINSIRNSELEQWGRGAAVPAAPIITTQVFTEARETERVLKMNDLRASRQTPLNTLKTRAAAYLQAAVGPVDCWGGNKMV